MLGTQNGTIWFHIDSDPGASYWDNVKDYSDLIRIGVSLDHFEG